MSATHGGPAARGRAGGGRGKRPSLGGGLPAQDRALRAQGRQTVSRLLAAALAEFDEHGFQSVRVDDIVRRAQTSHGTFYLYFANKEDLFRALLRDALDDMQTLTDEFPVVTRNDAGRAALRRWVGQFCDTYAAHAAVIRALSQAEIVSEEVWGDGLKLLFRLAEAMTLGMTAGAGQPAGSRQPASAGQPASPRRSAPQRPPAASRQPASQRPAAPAGLPGQGGLTGHVELTALACLMMLERVNYLLSVEVRLPREEMVDRITAIMFAAFQTL